MFSSALGALLAALVALVFLQQRFWPYLGADVVFYVRVLRCKWALRRGLRRGICSLVRLFSEQARIAPDRPFLRCARRCFTYGQVEAASNRVARALHGRLRPGDTAAMLLGNEPAFVWLWFGLSKLGLTVAFLNVNVRRGALLHCCRSCSARGLLVGADLMDEIEDILPELQDMGIQVWVMRKRPLPLGVSSLLEEMEVASEEPVPADLSTPSNPMSTFLYIFTSGTTGLPKAARISHLKSIMCCCFYQLCGASSDDIIYLALPLYHMSASLLGIGGCIGLGASCVLKEKFSAGQFWSDCRKYNVTVFQYVGELCRYLVNQPKSEGDMDHKVRLIAGSGLRPDVWKEFSQRFGKIRIFETYGMTEANISFFNYTDMVGAVGRGTFIYRLVSPFELVKYDILEGEPFRNKDRRCVKVAKGETGLLLCPLTTSNPFLGYAGSQELSEKKVLRDVFWLGDSYFNTGDLMVQDHEDFVYFRDRTGDTYRWKGENVSTTEVGEIVGALGSFQEVNIYGVTVPGHEGRAGMAALVLRLQHKFDGKRLYHHVVDLLPFYSIPRFVRIQDSLDITETFKQQKVRLVQEGFDPLAIVDPLYFLDTASQSYIPLTEALYEAIVTGHVRV